MLNRNGYVSKETVCAEIARFKGYLDEDMIARIQLAINRLPDEITEVLPADYDSFDRKMTGSVSDTNKNRGAHGDSSFMLGGMPSSSENPPALAVGSVKRCTEWRGEHAVVVDNHVNYIDKLALYEDKDEKGLLYLLPAPLGSTVYSVHDRCRAPYWDCPFMGGFGMSRCDTKEHCESYYEPIELCFGDLNYIGVTIFLTEEEAKESVERNNAK